MPDHTEALPGDPARPVRATVSTGASAAKPLLMVDIDGVLSVYGFDPTRRPRGTFQTIDGILHFLSAEASENLLSLLTSFDAVWCSGWEEKANEYLPQLLGMPAPLPFLSFPRTRAGPAAHWKLAAIDDYARARPLAWIDDTLDEECRRWASARSAPTLLVATTPALGLTRPQARQLLDWARALRP